MIALLLFACGTDDSKDGISVDVPTTSQFSVDDFENVNCQDVTGTPANGASAYYVGNFALNGNSLDGVESAFFIASETLSENSDWEEGYCEGIRSSQGTLQQNQKENREISPKYGN